MKFKYEVQVFKGKVWRTVYVNTDLKAIRATIESIKLYYPNKLVRLI